MTKGELNVVADRLPDEICLNKDHGDGYVYVTVEELIVALQKMPQKAKVLLTVQEQKCCHSVNVTGIPCSVSLTKHLDYYLHDEVVEIS
jgi:hypothetical protein